MRLFEWLRSRREPDGEWWDRVHQLEARQKALELEWEETFESIKRNMARLAKRAKSLESTENGLQEVAGGTAERPVGRMSATEYGQRLAAARARYGRSG